MLLETTVKFITSMMASTSPLTENGFKSALNSISKFKLLPEDDKPVDKKKELPAGGFELAIGLFEGLEGPK